MIPIQYESHEIAEVFPPMAGPDFDSLKEDIRARGLLEPVWLYGDKILDGRNRYRACAELGIEPAVRIYAGDDPIGFAVALNLKRRHLSESQRAVIADRIANMGEGRPQVHAITAQICAVNGPPVAPVSQAKAAEIMGVSRRSVQSAKRVREKAAPALKEAVEKGEVKVSAAAEVADLPPSEQDEAVATHSVAEKAAEVRKGKSKVNGTVQDDPAYVAKLRANGKIPAGAVVEVTNPTREPGEDEPDPITEKEASLDDMKWLESLASRATIEPHFRPKFDADAILYRAMDEHRKTFAYHATRAINKARWKMVYAYRIRLFLSFPHPKHWVRCPPMAADAGGGCGGVGSIQFEGKSLQCPKCIGRGYWVP